jgi:hypothetical protein
MAAPLVCSGNARPASGAAASERAAGDGAAGEAVSALEPEAESAETDPDPPGPDVAATRETCETGADPAGDRPGQASVTATATATATAAAPSIARRVRPASQLAPPGFRRGFIARPSS